MIEGVIHHSYIQGVLTVLSLDFGDAGDVSSTEGMGGAREEEEDGQSQKDGQRLERKHCGGRHSLGTQ